MFYSKVIIRFSHSKTMDSKTLTSPFVEGIKEIYVLVNRF